MKTKALILLLITQSCGQLEHQDFTHVFTNNELPDHFIEPEFVPIIMEYAEMLKENQISTKLFKKIQRIEYKTINDTKSITNGEVVNIIGKCSVYSSRDVFGKTKEYRLIEIDPKLTGDEVRDTLFHELGHCVNNLGHNEDPGSIMYESALDTDVNWEQRKEDLVSYIKGH